MTQRNHIDLVLLLAVMVLMVLSVGIVYSASSTWALEKYKDSGELMGRHLVKVLMGFVAIFITMHIDYRMLKGFSKTGILVSVGLLVLTLMLGGETKGATRWIRFGAIGFQPSELAKYALLIHISTLLSEKKERISDYTTGFLPVLVWIGTVTVLVLAQPNFSNGVMIVVIGVVMLFIGRARFKHMALTLMPFVLLLGIYMVSAEYRLRRIASFLSGTGEGGRMNYQLYQGIIGFGNGGLFGLGPGESRQRDLFLPESYGDFVFSIVGEEYGLVGTIFFLILFVTIMLRGMRIARYARDSFGRFLAVGITVCITLYALVNACVALGILPTTGLPMPFVSYGGSSMLFSAVAIGILLNISSQTDMFPRVVHASDEGLARA